VAAGGRGARLRGPGLNWPVEWPAAVQGAKLRAARVQAGCGGCAGVRGGREGVGPGRAPSLSSQALGLFASARPRSATSSGRRCSSCRASAGGGGGGGQGRGQGRVSRGARGSAGERGEWPTASGGARCAGALRHPLLFRPAARGHTLDAAERAGGADMVGMGVCQGESGGRVGRGPGSHCSARRRLPLPPRCRRPRRPDAHPRCGRAGRRARPPRSTRCRATTQASRCAPLRGAQERRGTGGTGPRHRRPRNGGGAAASAARTAARRVSRRAAVRRLSSARPRPLRRPRWGVGPRRRGRDRPRSVGSAWPHGDPTRTGRADASRRVCTRPGSPEPKARGRPGQCPAPRRRASPGHAPGQTCTRTTFPIFCRRDARNGAVIAR
jgi:hypothetical protein